MVPFLAKGGKGKKKRTTASYAKQRKGKRERSRPVLFFVLTAKKEGKKRGGNPEEKEKGRKGSP